MIILIRDLQNLSIRVFSAILSVWDSTQRKVIRLKHHCTVYSVALSLTQSDWTLVML